MGAFSALQKFVLDKLLQFGQKASRADCDGTSRLSPHIHFGEISIAFVYHVVSPPPWPARALTAHE